MALLFETSEAVDDIRCELADGTAIVLQVKRTCGADEQLQRTVSQWAGHLPDLKTRDRMGLATANPRGPVRVLGAALTQRQRALPGPFSTFEQEALDAVRDRFPAGTSQPADERLLDTALVMTVATETERDSDFRYAASLLDGTVFTICSRRASSSAQPWPCPSGRTGRTTDTTCPISSSVSCPSPPSRNRPAATAAVT
jgi:hypothetical protein